MKTGENIYSRLFALANQAKAFREVFDRFWIEEPTRRPLAHHTYFIREVSLVNAFDNFLFLFCSRNLWSAGGTGAWATSCGVKGPLKSLSNGDQIDQLITLLSDHPEAATKILSLHKTEVEVAHMTYELDHIANILDLFSRSMKEIQI